MYKVELVYPNKERKTKVECKTETLAFNVWKHYVQFFAAPGYTKSPDGTSVSNSEVEVEISET